MVYSGKNNMEHTDEIKKGTNDTRDAMISIAFIVAIFLVCFLLIILIIVLLKNLDEIKTDPVTYGVIKNNFTYCSCFDPEKDRNVEFTADGPTPFRYWANIDPEGRTVDMDLFGGGVINGSG